MNSEFETIELPPIDVNNNRETELAKIDDYRKAHLELLEMARRYDAPEARQTLSDIETIDDKAIRQSLLKSLLLGLAGDPGSCDRLSLQYMAGKLADSANHAQADFWVRKMNELLSTEQSEDPLLTTIHSVRGGRFYASLKEMYGVKDVGIRQGTQLSIRFDEAASIGPGIEVELAQAFALALHLPVRVLEFRKEQRLVVLSWAT